MKLEIKPTPSDFADKTALFMVIDDHAPLCLTVCTAGSFLECAEYIADKHPKDLTGRMIEALNQANGPTHMGEPVLLAAGRWSASAPTLQNIPNYTTEEAKRLVAEFHAAHPTLQIAFDPAGPPPDYTPLEQRTLAAALEQELQPKARPLNRMELALLDWWRDRRPIFSDSVAHALEPTINCHSPAEDKMANMAAELFIQACENGLLSYEPALAPVEDL